MKLSPWLKSFADSKAVRKINAGYLDEIERLVAMHNSNPIKYATVDDALEDFRIRIGLSKKEVRAMYVMAMKRKAGFPVDAEYSEHDAIANEMGNTPEEKRKIKEKLKGRKEEDRNQQGEIARSVSTDPEQGGLGSDGQPGGGTKDLPSMGKLNDVLMERFGKEIPLSFPGEWPGEVPGEPTAKDLDNATRYVGLDFRGDIPKVSIYVVRSIIMTSKKMRDALYRDIKKSLIGSIGRMLGERFEQFYEEKDPIDQSVLFQNVLNKFDRLVMSEQFGGVEDQQKAMQLIDQLFDFYKTNPEGQQLLRQVFEKINYLYNNPDITDEEKAQVRQEMEGLYSEMETINKATAEEFHGLIDVPYHGPGGRKGKKVPSLKKFYAELPKQQRIEILKIFMSQLHLDDKIHHTGTKVVTGFGPVSNKVLEYNPIDNKRFLDEDGLPTDTDTGVPNSNFGNAVNFSKYPIVGNIQEKKEALKFMIFGETKEAIMFDQPLTTDKEGQPVSLSSIPELVPETITMFSDEYQEKAQQGEKSRSGIRDLSRFEIPETPDISEANLKGLSKKAQEVATLPDVFFFDSKDRVFNTEDELIEKNIGDFDQGSEMLLAEEVDQLLLADPEFEEEVLPVEEEALPLAAELGSKIKKIAQEVDDGETKEEAKELYELSSIAKGEK